MLLFGSTKDLHSLHTLLLLAMTTCFMFNQICRAGGGLQFLFDSYALLLYRTLLFVNTTLLCDYGATRIWNLRAFIIWLIPGSPPSLPLADWRAWELGYSIALHGFQSCSHTHHYYPRIAPSNTTGTACSVFCCSLFSYLPTAPCMHALHVLVFAGSPDASAPRLSAWA